MKTVETNKYNIAIAGNSPILAVKRYNLGGKVPLISNVVFVGLDNLERNCTLVRGTLPSGMEKEASPKTVGAVDEL